MPTMAPSYQPPHIPAVPGDYHRPRAPMQNMLDDGPTPVSHGPLPTRACAIHGQSSHFEGVFTRKGADGVDAGNVGCRHPSQVGMFKKLAYFIRQRILKRAITAGGRFPEWGSAWWAVPARELPLTAECPTESCRGGLVCGLESRTRPSCYEKHYTLWITLDPGYIRSSHPQLDRAG